MPLKLIHGPPNSGRAGLDPARASRRRSSATRSSSCPTVDDVFAFERELCAEGAVLGGAVMTFGGLFRTVATAGGAPPGAELTPAQRLRRVAVGGRARGARGSGRCGAPPPGPASPRAFERLLDELQGAGRRAARRSRPSAATLEGSAYLGDIATLFAGYAEVRDAARPRRRARRSPARRSRCCARDGAFWGERPVFLYGLDDLTPNQFDLVAALARGDRGDRRAPLRGGQRGARGARAALLDELRERIGVDRGDATEADPANTESAAALPPRARLRRARRRAAARPTTSLVLLRSAGERGEAEAIAAEVSRLLAAGADPAEIAIALRDPARRGPLIAAALEANGIATALEAELPVAGTAVGGALVALLEAEFGDRPRRRPAALPARPLGLLAGPGRLARARRCGAAGSRTRRRRWRSGRARTASRRATCVRLREAAARSPAALAAEVGRLAATMASRPLRGEGDGPALGRGDGLELRAAGGDRRRARRAGRARRRWRRAPAELAATDRRARASASGAARSRAGCGSPSPYRLRAGALRPRLRRLAAGRRVPAPRPRRRPLPLRSASATSLGLDPRRDSEAEERYLFHVCLALPRRRLFLSYRDSDENGGAEARSPLLDDVRALLAPAPDGAEPDPVEAAITRGRDLAQVVAPLAEAPSEDELARALAAHGPGADAGGAARRGRRRRRAARRGSAAGSPPPAGAEAAARAPGPLTNPAVLESLAAVPAYGGTTLEGFDVCSYRWFAGHELDPQPLDPVPDPLVQGGLMHAALDRLYKERPGGDPLPRPGSLAAWIGARPRAGRRGRRRARARRAPGRAGDGARGSSGCSSASSPRRPSARPAASSPGCWRPRFGEHEDSERPALELDGWGLHGAIDRVDRAADGRALVIDYKLSGSVTPREKFEEQAKLQLPLYLLAVAEHWGADAGRRPLPPAARHLGAAPARRRRSTTPAGDLAGYGLYDTRRGRRARSSRSCWRTSRRRAGEIVARMRAGEIRRDPGPRRGLRGHDVCPPFCDFAPICRRDRAPAVRGGRGGGGAMSERAPTPEQAAAIEASGARRPARGRRRHRQDRGDGRPLLPPRLRRGRLPRRDPRLHLHRQGGGRAAPADPGRAGAPGRGGLGARRASCWRAIGGAWVTTIHGFCNRLLAGPPGRRRDRPRLPRPRRPGDRRAPPARPSTRRSAEFLAGGDRRVARGDGRRLRHRRAAGDRRRRPRRAAQPRRRRAAAAASRRRRTPRRRSRRAAAAAASAWRS